MRRPILPTILFALAAGACSDGPADTANVGAAPSDPSLVGTPGTGVTAPGVLPPVEEPAMPVQPTGEQPSEQPQPGLQPQPSDQPQQEPGGQQPAPTPEPVIVPVSGTQTKLRMMTAPEYTSTLRLLFGGDVSIPDLPEDNSIAGFASIASSRVPVSGVAIEKYEAAARAVVEEVFSEEARWMAHVGCEPAPGLDGNCTADYLNRFGRLALRHRLSEDEASTWTTLAATLAADSGSRVEALKTTTATLLQSPLFLYRVETATGDGTSDRFTYDAYSTATRLAFLLTGATPDDALLKLAEDGSLSTADGVRAAAAQLASAAENTEHLRRFFVEFAGLERIGFAAKHPDFGFSDELRTDMMREAEMWLDNVVLAQARDVRDFFDSPTTYVNARLAEHYGLEANGDGFAEVQYPAESGRAGLFGKGSFLAAYSSSDISAPTRRGVFVMGNILCQIVPEVPPGLVTELPEEDPDGAPRTTRQRFEEHVSNPACAGCHSLMDNYGFALENFDPVGRYRETENGLPVVATTQLFGTTDVSGGVELAKAIREDEQSRRCLVERFYKYANAESELSADKAFVGDFASDYQDRLFNWRQFLAEFAASDAFMSAPTDTRTLVTEIEGEHE